LYFQGAILGSEFLIYAATKLYIAFNYSTSGTLSVTAVYPGVTLYDENNVVSGYFTNVNPYWDATGAVVKYCRSYLILSNIYFSRVLHSQYESIKFSGFRITLI